MKDIMFKYKNIFFFSILFLLISGISSKFIINDYVQPEKDNILKSILKLENDKNIYSLEIICEDSKSSFDCLNFFFKQYNFQHQIIKDEINSTSRIFLFFNNDEDIDVIIDKFYLKKLDIFLKKEKIKKKKDLFLIFQAIENTDNKSEFIEKIISENVLNFNTYMNIGLVSANKLKNNDAYLFFKNSNVKKDIEKSKKSLANKKQLSLNYLNVFILIFLILIFSLFFINFIIDLIKILKDIYRK